MSKRNWKVGECKEYNEDKSLNYYSSKGHWRGFKLMCLMQPIHRAGVPQNDSLPKLMSKLVKLISVVRLKLIHPPKCLAVYIIMCRVVYACGGDWVRWKGEESKSWEPAGWLARLSSRSTTTRRWICLLVRKIGRFLSEWLSSFFENWYINWVKRAFDIFTRQRCRAMLLPFCP